MVSSGATTTTTALLNMTVLIAFLFASSTNGFAPIHRFNYHQDVTFLQRSSSSTRLKSTQAEAEDDEWSVPRNPASTTPELLSSLWSMISKGCATMTRGQEMTMIYPNMQTQLAKADYVERLMDHLNVCKDVCDDFGINTLLIPKTDLSGSGRIIGFTVKSYKNPDVGNQDDDTGGYKFTNDPFWNDDLEIDIDPSLFEDDDDDDTDDWKSGLGVAPQSPIEISIPDEDEEIISTTKTWVSRLMSDMGVCPFTSGADLAGLPMGKVYYTVSRDDSVENMYARYWSEVVRVERATEKELSTTLLVTPHFAMENVELFETFSNTLTQPLEGLAIEDLIQLVFFHPVWTFRDGAARGGEQSAANYARRSPWPMINILRTNQVRAAQRGIPTGLVYQQNERTLSQVGAERLEQMLRRRTWDELEGYKVDRRQMEALRVAQDLQQTQQLKMEDTQMQSDSTPAVNKIDRKQIEGGDMVNVIRQALEKRLDQNTRLSGPETSAALMATDFLLDYLDDIITGEINKQDARGESEMKVMFGGDSGFLQDMDDDGKGNPYGGNYAEGLNPSNFY